MVINLKLNSNIRKIDELGRIVIPKDIRKKLHIYENDMLEIYINDDVIQLEKYSVIDDGKDEITDLLDIANRITENLYIVANKVSIIASCDRKLVDLKIPDNISKSITNCVNIQYPLIINGIKYYEENCLTLMLNIDSTNQGMIIAISKNGSPDLNTLKLLKTIIEKKLNSY